MGIKTIRLLILALCLSGFTGCLKNNGEPYPGTASNNNNPSNPRGDGTDIEIDFPDGENTLSISCTGADANIQASLFKNSVNELTLTVSESVTAGDAASLSVIAGGSAVENHNESYRTYIASTAKLYISRILEGERFPATLKIKRQSGGLWESISLTCNNTGYSPD